MYQFMWRTLTFVFVLSALALSANAQTSSNATANSDKNQATSQANQGQAPAASAPAASNAQKNPQATAPKAQPGVNQRTPAGNQRQPIRTDRIQENRNAATQPNLSTQPVQPTTAPANVPGQTRTGVVGRSTQTTPLNAPNRELLQQRQSQFGQRTVFRPEVLRGPDIGVWFNPAFRDGLVISDVVATGPFARLGFLEGDRIVSVNGRRVLAEPDFMQFLLANNANPVEVVIFRNGRNEKIIVDPTILTQDSFVAEVSPLEQFGIVLDDRFNDRVVVWQVLPQSPAFYAGFRPGDVITTLSGQPFRTRAEFETAVVGMRPGQANVQVRRGDRARDLVVDVPQFTRTAQRGGVEQRAGDRIQRSGASPIDQGRNNQGANQPQNNPPAPNTRGGTGERGINR